MTLKTKTFWFVLWSVICFCAGTCFGQARIPAYAATIAMQARSELAAIDPEAAEFTQYLWSPSGSDVDFAASAVAVNTALNQRSTESIPQRLFGGALIAIDLRTLADNEDELAFVLHEWFRHAEDEHYFHIQARDESGNLRTHVVTCPKFQHTDGKWYTSRTAKVVVVAPHVTHNIHYPLARNMPVGLVYRVDEFVSRVLSSVGRGTYLRWRRLTPGATKLNDYLKSRQIEQPKNIERAAVRSEVTGGPRGIRFWNGQSTVPTQGAGVFWITDDVSKDVINDESNAFRNVRDLKNVVHEGIATLSSGWLEYTLWDQQDILAKNAPEDVAKNKGRHPWDERIHGAITCIQCHGPNEGFQPFRNAGRDKLIEEGFDFSGRFIGFRTGKDFEELQLILSEFRAPQHQIDALLQNSRDYLSQRTFAVTRQLGELNRMNAKPASEAVASVVEGYEQQWVTPAIAAQELGFAVPVDDPTGAKTIQFALPRLPIVVNDPAAELRADNLDLRSRAPISGKMTRREWEGHYPVFAIRSKPALEAAMANAARDSREMIKQGFNVKREAMQ